MKTAGKRGLLLALVVAMLITGAPAGIVYATSTQEKLNQAKEEKEQTESQLNETKENLEGLKEEKNQLEGKLADLNQKLTVVSNNLNDLEGQIADKEVEIKNTEEDMKLIIEIVRSQFI